MQVFVREPRLDMVGLLLHPGPGVEREVVKMTEASISEVARERFRAVPGYLNTAAVGLPTREAMEALRRRLVEWEEGRCDPPSFDPDVARCRDAYARIAGTEPPLVGIVSQASVVSGMVAASMAHGSVVLCAGEEFTSVTFPFLEDPRLTVRVVPLAELLDSIAFDVDLVAVSAVQSSDGRAIDLDRLVDLAHRFEAKTYVDATQAAGWLPLGSDRFDVTVCHGYKWLCAPRGAGFLTVSGHAMDWLRPIDAGWYAGEEPWQSIYGPPLRLAADARRFDVSPAWFSYSAAVPGLEFLADLGPEAIGEHSVGLANEFRRLVGLEPSNSAIVSVDTSAGPALAEAGIIVSARAGKARFSFYVYNTEADVEHAASIVTAAG